jgi:hypothetical protein
MSYLEVVSVAHSFTKSFVLKTASCNCWSLVNHLHYIPIKQLEVSPPFGRINICFFYTTIISGLLSKSCFKVTISPGWKYTLSLSLIVFVIKSRI